MMRKTKTFWLILMPLLFASSVLANEKEITQYQVEMILFEQTNNSNTSERFDQQTLVPSFPENIRYSQLLESDDESDAANSSVIDPIITSVEIPEFELKEGEESALSKDLGSLKRSSRYRVIRHKIWQQPGLDRENTFPVSIQSGFPFVVISKIEEKFAIKNPDEQPLTKVVDYYQLMAEWYEIKKLQGSDEVFDSKADPVLPMDFIEYLNQAGLTAQLSFELDGFVTLVRTRYLHFYPNLIWNIRLEDQEMAPLAIPEIEEEKDEQTLQAEEMAELKEEENLSDEPVEADTLAIDEEDRIIIPGMETLGDIVIQSYPFQAHRKMRSKRKHFIDHPMLGLIVHVIDVKELVKPEDIESPGETTGISN